MAKHLHHGYSPGLSSARTRQWSREEYVKLLDNESAGQKTRLQSGGFLDGDFTAIVATLTTHTVVNVPCATIGAYCQCRHSSLIVSSALCGTGL